MSTYVRLRQPALGFNAGQVVLIGDDTVANAIINGGSGVATVRWTFNQFMNRFTGPEQAALATAAGSNPQLFLFFSLGAGANSVDPTDPAVVAEMNILVVDGLLTQQRENQILNPGTTSP